jgi:kynurenine formamidase
MNFEIKLLSGTFEINSDNPIDISVPLIFGGEQPNIYDAPKASSKACEIGDFIGDTRRGGSCNFEEYKLIPHCNGTHTECIGHISFERVSIWETLQDVFIPSTLITVASVKAGETDDTYNPPKNDNDYLITKDSLESALDEADESFFDGLIIRTLPNDESKKSRRYAENPPPFFSLDAMNYIAERGIKHLLVDIPSVDRNFDEGKLSCHHIFWNVEQGTNRVDVNNHSMNTITEMIYVPNEVADGNYLLNLQIASFVSDAAPSRPVIFRIKN